MLMTFVKVPQHVGIAFMRASGLTDTDHYSVIAGITEHEVEDVIAKIVVEGTPLTLGDKAKIRNLFLVGRGILGVAAPASRPPATPTTTTEAPAPSQSKTTADTLQLSEVIIQTSKAEVRMLAVSEINKARRRYRLVMGINPPEEEQVTREQLSALNTVIKELDSIFADFGVWVPFWTRLANKRRFMDRIIDESGTFRVVEILGPPNFDSWEACFQTFITSCIMFELVDHGVLLRYVKQIRNYVRQYPRCWGLFARQTYA